MKKCLVCATLAVATLSSQAQLPPTAESASDSQSAATAYPLQPESGLRLDRYDGPALRETLGYGAVLHPNSSLRREWYVVRDDKAPLALEGEVAVRFSRAPGPATAASAHSRLVYQASYRLHAREPIMAFEVRIHLLDVFGRLIRTLSSVELSDVAGAQVFQARWQHPAAEAPREIFATVAYVARVRTASGLIYEPAPAALLDQLRKVWPRLTEADLRAETGALAASD